MFDAPATFGDVTAEYLALRDGCGLVAGYHELVWVRGPDAVSFLQGLLSQDIEAMRPSDVAAALLLGPQGKLRATLAVLRSGVDVGLLCHAGRGEVVAGDLSRFKIRVDVAIEREVDPIIDLWGPSAAAVVAAVGHAPPDQGWVGGDGGPVVARVRFARTRLPRLVTTVDRDRLVGAGARPAGSLAVTAVRVETGEPIVGVDVDERTIPAEAALVTDAVSFTKGCYLGQELVARIDSRGHVNRQLRGVVLGDAVLPPIGAEVVDAGKPVGALTSVAESLELRAPIGLALVRREVEPGTAVRVRWHGGAADAHIADLPLDDFASIAREG